MLISSLRNRLKAEQAGYDGVEVMRSEDYLLLTQTIYIRSHLSSDPTALTFEEELSKG
jgi:hypothetical protein